MKANQIRRTFVILVLWWAAILALLAISCSKQKISDPVDYDSLTPQWKGYERASAYVTVQDGTKLAVDYYLPSGYLGTGVPVKIFPVVFQYTPYSRGYINPVSGKVIPGFARHSDLFLAQGYAVVIADMRGAGASFGWMLDYSPKLGDDGKEIVEWIATQPWCDGNVGMAGGSYVGWSQIATASRAPKALKCIIPSVCPLEGYTGEVYPGGIYAYAFLQMWSGYVYGYQRNFFPPFGLPSPPVIDEDEDGEIQDEIPLDKNMNGTFLDDYPWPVDSSNPPRYPDGIARKNHYYFNATSEHHVHPDGAPGNYDLDTWARDMFFIDYVRPMDGVSVLDLLPNFVPQIMESGIPVYNVGGWFDAFCKGSFKLFATMKETNPSRVLIPPVYHQGLAPGFAQLLGIDVEGFNRRLGIESLRWYDRWLKGIQNGIEKEPPVLIYVMNGQGWRAEEEWPLAREVRTHVYFEGGNRLSSNNQSHGSDEYKADFSHNSGWTGPSERWQALEQSLPKINAMIGKPAPTFQGFKTNRFNMFGTPVLPDRAELDKQCITYTSAPMEEDTEVTGHPIVHIWVSSTADYGDFFFYLEDVDENGRVILITEYPLRAGFAGLYDDDLQISGGYNVDVKPDLPWHGYRKADYVDKIFAEDKVVELVNDLHPTSWVFKRGHSIRLAIACADWPTFRLHPKLAPSNRPDDPHNIVPTITIYRDKLRPSHIELPIIPAKNSY